MSVKTPYWEVFPATYEPGEFRARKAQAAAKAAAEAATILNVPQEKVEVRELEPADIDFPSESSPGYDVTLSSTGWNDFTYTHDVDKAYVIYGIQFMGNAKPIVSKVQFVVDGVDRPKNGFVVFDAWTDPQGKVAFRKILPITRKGQVIKFRLYADSTGTQKMRWLGWVGELAAGATT